MDQGPDYQEVELTLPPLGRERRPLSAFAAPPQPSASAFQPAFEVDGFTWPNVVNQLVTESRRLFQPVVELLQANVRSGRSLVGLAGASHRVGCTTVTMCLARLLAEVGLRTAVVDANFANGALAAQLGVEFEQGWDQALAGNIPLAECAVQSLQDAVVLIPLAGPAPEARTRLSSIQTAVLAGIVRYHYDVVLFDLGAATDPAQAGAMATLIEHCRLDAGIQIARSGAKDAATTQAIAHLTQLFGANSLGTIGNRAA
jgi:Mrp family chromosome partitioning ATPase